MALPLADKLLDCGAYQPLKIRVANIAKMGGVRTSFRSD
jgi:hypothetical protein